MNYKDAGVDIVNGDLFIDKIRPSILKTYDKNVISGVGGFCALYEVSKDKWLASGTDGVGTKVKLAQELDNHKTIGQDLVSMCVNDIICSGAKPLFFLDYLAVSKLELEIHTDLLNSIADACLKTECALIGGETAEMPGVYAEGVYDLAGFAVGELSPLEHISGKKIRPGHKLIGLYSSGFHSNGFSLVRKLISSSEIELKKKALTPTVLYWPIIKEVLKNQRENILGIAHITGGGLYNIPRINDAYSFRITALPNLKERLPFMHEIIKRARMSFHDEISTFNMGVGMVLCCRDDLKLKEFLNSINIEHMEIGEVIDKKENELEFSILQ